MAAGGASRQCTLGFEPPAGVLKVRALAGVSTPRGEGEGEILPPSRTAASCCSPRPQWVERGDGVGLRPWARSQSPHLPWPQRAASFLQPVPPGAGSEPGVRASGPRPQGAGWRPRSRQRVGSYRKAHLGPAVGRVSSHGVRPPAAAVCLARDRFQALEEARAAGWPHLEAPVRRDATEVVCRTAERSCPPRPLFRGRRGLSISPGVSRGLRRVRPGRGLRPTQ